MIVRASDLLLDTAQTVSQQRQTQFSLTHFDPYSKLIRVMI